MNPPIGLLTPVKAAIGRWIADFHGQFIGDTPANVAWAKQPTALAFAWAPARMVDQVEPMLSEWRRNDNTGRPGSSAKCPALIVCVSNDYTETPGEAGRPLTDEMPIAFPYDPLKRSFRARLMSVDLRGQVVVIAPDALSSMSIIGQLCLWAIARRTFKAPFPFAGFSSMWPVQLVGADRIGITNPVGEHLSVLALDLTIRAAIPLFRGPRGAEYADGNEPPGFAVVREVHNEHDMQLGPPTGVSAEEWARFTRLVTWADGPTLVALSPVGDAR